MLVCASITAQPIESQGNKNFFPRTMQTNYAGFARSVVGVVDFFAGQPLAGSWHAGLVSAWSHREGLPGAPGRRVSLDGSQPIIDKLDGAADLGLREWHVKEPLDFLRDFGL
jgi:hypothetical protein